MLSVRVFVRLSGYSMAKFVRFCDNGPIGMRWRRFTWEIRFENVPRMCIR